MIGLNELISSRIRTYVRFFQTVSTGHLSPGLSRLACAARSQGAAPTPSSASRPDAASMRTDSDHARPSSDSPTGRPETVPIGTVIEGYPATAAIEYPAPRKLSPFTWSISHAGPVVKHRERVEMLAAERKVDPLRAGLLDAALPRLFVLRVRERTRARRTLEEVLTEQRKLRLGELAG